MVGSMYGGGRYDGEWRQEERDVARRRRDTRDKGLQREREPTGGLKVAVAGNDVRRRDDSECAEPASVVRDNLMAGETP